MRKSIRHGMISAMDLTARDWELLTAQMLLHEGLRLTAYQDTAIPPRWTIGVGYNITDRGWDDLELTCDRELNLNSRLSRREAMAQLKTDLESCRHWLSLYYPWMLDLDAIRQRVLIDLRFNVGPRTFQTFNPTFEYLKTDDYGIVARRMLQWKWAKQVKMRATRLSKMMETGEDSLAITSS